MSVIPHLTLDQSRETAPCTKSLVFPDKISRYLLIESYNPCFTCTKVIQNLRKSCLICIQKYLSQNSLGPFYTQSIDFFILTFKYSGPRNSITFVDPLMVTAWNEYHLSSKSHISYFLWIYSVDEPSVLINTGCPYPATVMVYKYLGEIIKLERVKRVCRGVPRICGRPHINSYWLNIGDQATL